MAESIGKRGEHGSQNLHQRATLTKLVLSQGNYYVGTNKGVYIYYDGNKHGMKWYDGTNR